jgi:hypothetical protein
VYRQALSFIIMETKGGSGAQDGEDPPVDRRSPRGGKKDLDYSTMTDRQAIKSCQRCEKGKAPKGCGLCFTCCRMLEHDCGVATHAYREGGDGDDVSSVESEAVAGTFDLNQMDQLSLQVMSTIAQAGAGGAPPPLWR